MVHHDGLAAREHRDAGRVDAELQVHVEAVLLVVAAFLRDVEMPRGAAARRVVDRDLLQTLRARSVRLRPTIAATTARKTACRELSHVSSFRARVALRPAALSGTFRLKSLLRVVLEDHLLVGVAQPVDRLDRKPRLVQPSTRARVHHRADAGPLGPEHAPVDADGLEQQLERVLRVEHGVVVQVTHLFGEARRALAPQRAGLETRELVRDRAAAV